MAERRCAGSRTVLTRVRDGVEIRVIVNTGSEEIVTGYPINLPKKPLMSGASHFDELQGRLRGLLISIAERLPSMTVGLVDEMIDANECGIALETISETLAESGARFEAADLLAVERLAHEMALEEITVDRLRPLVQRPGSRGV